MGFFKELIISLFLVDVKLIDINNNIGIELKCWIVFVLLLYFMG